MIVLTRGVVPFEHVTAHREMPLRNGTRAGHLRLSQISSSVLHELRKYEAQWQNGLVRSVVLDLRYVYGESGENVHNAVTLADGLLDGGEIGQLRTTRDIKRYKAGPDCLFRDWPMVVLIGPNTSGTAEWLAAALKDNGRAVLVGSPTHGKGTINTAVPLPNTDLVLTMNTVAMERADGTPIESKQRDARPIVHALSVDNFVDGKGRGLFLEKPLTPRNGRVTPDHPISVFLPRLVMRNGRLVIDRKAAPNERREDPLTKAIEVLNGLVAVESETKPATPETPGERLALEEADALRQEIAELKQAVKDLNFRIEVLKNRLSRIDIPEKLKGMSVVLIGIIDTDSDGKNDLHSLRRHLISSGVQSVSFVNDEGILTDGRLTSDTLFIVVGKIPNPALAKSAGEKDSLQKAMNTFKELRKQARKLGVRIVSAKDFIDYISYPPEPD